MAGGKGGIIASLISTWDDRGLNAAKKDFDKFEQQSRTASSTFGSLNGVVKTLGATIAATFTISAVSDFFKDSIANALEDEKALTSLNRTLSNLGFGAAAEQVQVFIDKTQLATGVADDQLRPAFDRLVRSAGSVEEAQRLMQIALDASAGTGKDLQEVANALGRAYDGNTTALGRLGLGIDKATLKNGDLNEITDRMSKLFAGQASDAANTYQGKINRVTVAANEAKETIGYALLDAVDNLSNAFGGTGGAQESISQFGRGVAGLITDIGNLVNALGRATNATNNKTKADEYSQDGYRKLVTAIPIVGTYLSVLSKRNEDNAREAARARNAFDSQNSAMSGTVIAAVQLGNKMSNLRDKTVEGGDAAFYAAKSYTALWQSIVNQQRVARDYANTSGTVSSAIAEGVTKGADLTEAKLKEIRDSLGKTGSAGSSAAKQVAESFKTQWGEAQKSVNDSLEAMSVTISGKSAEMSDRVNEKYKSQLDAFKLILSEQSSAIVSARKALDDYASSVTKTILGGLTKDFDDAIKATTEDGKALTPEQIVQAWFGSAANRQAAVEQIATIVDKLPEQLAQYMLTLPPTAAISLVDYFSNNPEALAKLTENYNKLAADTQTLLGIPMAKTWAKVGDQSAVSMIASAKQTISDTASDFRKWVRAALKTTVTVDVVYNAVNAPNGGGVQFRAAGGPVSAGSPYVVGEAGPELFVPRNSGSIVPNDKLGGNSYSINVQAGVGDPRQIGQQVVEYIKRFEAASGPVFASA